MATRWPIAGKRGWRGEEAQMNILAQAVSDGGSSRTMWMGIPTHWPQQTDLLNACQTMGPGAAVLLILAGIIYLLCGFYAFKILVTLNAALVGGYVGVVIGARSQAEIVGLLVGAFVAASLTWPLMRYAVAVMGGIFGGLLGASIWLTCDLNPQFAWAGGAIGLVLFGMLSFILFKASIMMYTSLQGSVMLVFGVLALIYKYPTVATRLSESMAIKPFLLPIFVFIPALIGILYQQAQYGQPDGGAKKK